MVNAGDDGNEEVEEIVVLSVVFDEVVLRMAAVADSEDVLLPVVDCEAVQRALPSWRTESGACTLTRSWIGGSWWSGGAMGGVDMCWTSIIVVLCVRE